MVLDLEVPDGGGMDLLKQIHTEQHPVQVIVLTASIELSVLRTVRLLHADAVLTKPIEVQALLRLLDEGP